MAHVVCLVMSGSRAEAKRIGDALVRERLAACANILDGVESAYWWQGRVERAREALLILKTQAALVRRLASRVRRLHSYTVPEVIALPIVSGNEAYLDWIDASVAPPKTSRRGQRRRSRAA